MWHRRMQVLVSVTCVYRCSTQYARMYMHSSHVCVYLLAYLTYVYTKYVQQHAVRKWFFSRLNFRICTVVLLPVYNVHTIEILHAYYTYTRVHTFYIFYHIFTSRWLRRGRRHSRVTPKTWKVTVWPKCVCVCVYIYYVCVGKITTIRETVYTALCTYRL